MKSYANEIRQGVAALVLLQALNYLFPLALLPFLTRQLGFETFGAFAYCLALAQFCTVITDYGFSLSGTARVARFRENAKKVERYFSAVMACKLLLALVTMSIVALYAALQNRYQNLGMLFAATTLAILGQALQPTWFFQGLGRFRLVASLTALSRLIYLGASLALVRTSEDVSLAMAANATGLLVSALLGAVIYFGAGFKLHAPCWRSIKATMRSSSEFFVSRIGVAAYNSFNSIFLGTFSTAAAVATYSAAEQLYRAGQAAINPVSQVIYPYMVRSPSGGLLARSLLLVAGVALSVVLCTAAAGREIVVTIFGPEFAPAAEPLLLLMMALLAYAPSTVLGYPLLAALGLASRANWSVIYAGGVQLCLLSFLALSQSQSPILVAGTVLVTETFLLGFRAVSANKIRDRIKK